MHLNGRKPRISKSKSSVARGMLLFAGMACLFGFGALAVGTLPACVIPPDLDIADPDGGVQPSPRITASGPAPEFSMPGPLVLDRGDERFLSLTIEHADVDDTLEIRFYVDYELPDPTQYVSDCVSASNGQLERIKDCPTATICSSVTDFEATHILTAMIVDQPFLPVGQGVEQPLYREVPPGTGSDISFWTLKCNSPAQ